MAYKSRSPDLNYAGPPVSHGAAPLRIALDTWLAFYGAVTLPPVMWLVNWIRVDLWDYAAFARSATTTAQLRAFWGVWISTTVAIALVATCRISRRPRELRGMGWAASALGIGCMEAMVFYVITHVQFGPT